MTDRAHIVTYSDGQPRKCVFPCQKIGQDGQRIQRECSVSVDPRFNGKVWTFTGPEDAPTLSPSIDCASEPCWHGFVVDGEVRA
ncbi:DUF6527 family protein [Caulobacter sp. UC70_42]|uniref:DUF6527 family protein n=1 Tax=Caulobacter sp. UC70_42 TaxID=3374551 RepID=UPI0037577320